MTNAASPIADFYPTTFAVDMEGKRAEWEGVVLICFIDETRLLQAEATIAQGRLTAEERARNKLGDILIYSHDDSLKDGACPLHLTKKIPATTVAATTVAVHGCFLACALQTEHALLEAPLRAVQELCSMNVLIAAMLWGDCILPWGNVGCSWCFWHSAHGVPTDIMLTSR